MKVTSDLLIRLSACHVSQQCTNEVDLGQGGFPMSVVFGPPLLDILSKLQQCPRRVGERNSMLN